ncbi:MAG: amidohydrolase family protein [Negativicutes bacterium]
MMATFDLIIKDGEVFDGLGNPKIKADVAIKDGEIACIGDLSNAIAKHWIDAKGLYVAPGFIDIHSHEDPLFFLEKHDCAKLMQGVTTELIGNCGISLAPVSTKYLPDLKKYWSQSISSPLPWDWTTFSQYLDCIENLKPMTNIAALVGHGTLRIAAMGFENRKPASDDLSQMMALLTEALDAGAFGMSSGLIYPPGVFASTDELVELSKIVAQYGGIYATHMRNEADTVLEAVEEAIEVAKRSGVSLHISHHKVAGTANWGKSLQTLKLMEDANQNQVSVTCDVYPYVAGSAMMSVLLPPWALNGGINAMLQRLRDKDNRERIKKELETGLPGWQNLYKASGWDKIVVAQHGVTLQKLADEKGVEPADALFNILLEKQGEVSMVLFMMSEDDVKNILKHPLTVVGSDGNFGLGSPHPRRYGTFPRVLAKYVREEKVISMEQAISKMTGLPAVRMGLKDRGVLHVGNSADIIIFDPDHFVDKATYSEPRQHPDGLQYVIINGEVVVDEGVFTGIRAGKVLRKKFKE